MQSFTLTDQYDAHLEPAENSTLGGHDGGTLIYWSARSLRGWLSLSITLTSSSARSYFIVRPARYSVAFWYKVQESMTAL